MRKTCDILFTMVYNIKLLCLWVLLNLKTVSDILDHTVHEYSCIIEFYIDDLTCMRSVTAQSTGQTCFLFCC